VLFPVCIIDDFLGPEASAGLVDFAIGNEARFAAARVHTSDTRNTIDAGFRDSMSFTGDFGPVIAPFRAALDASYDRIAADVGTNHFEREPTELHMAAHRDGQFLPRHIDMLTGKALVKDQRAVSLVYYCNRTPRAFSGGDLVMYAMMGGGRQVIEPQHDRLVAFPSFAPHEIERVEVLGNRFADARFALVAWMRRPAA
jgi:Rps23 Pro-64 3,4-dihydroxylase Tpa1-like proline 4-hydroxylase